MPHSEQLTKKGPDPSLSVVMAVYNGARYVRQAVESILAQTFDAFELVVVDDGSTDETLHILASYEDPRLIVVPLERNAGLTRALNRGIAASSGPLIARQDADDFSLRERLERQVTYLEANPRIALVGTGSHWIDDSDRLLRDWRPPTDPAEIQQRLLAYVPFLHGTFMFRRECLADAGGGYNEAMPVAQDCDLLLRISERWDVANLPELLYVHREHGNTVTARRGSDQAACLRRAQTDAIQRRLAYGWNRLGPYRSANPAWVNSARRRWLAQRYAWWSAAARTVDRRATYQFLLIALLLDPTEPDIWQYVRGILRRKVGLGRSNRTDTRARTAARG